MFENRSRTVAIVLCLAASIAASTLGITAGAQPASPSGNSPQNNAPGRPLRNRFPKRAAAYYRVYWGVDSLSAKAVESGELIRFSYRILDADKAAVLNDKDTEAFLNAPTAGIQLVIPTLEKVGKLRQTSPPLAGKTYWMAFSNPGRTVKRGDRINIVIGQFHADGLIVE